MEGGEDKAPLKPRNPILKESDTVQSLPAIRCIVKNNIWSVTFDLTSISKEEDLQLVELQVNFLSLKTPSKITVNIYLTRNEQGVKFVGSVTTTMQESQHSSWKSFNITSMMEKHLHWDNQLADKSDMKAMRESPSVASHPEFGKKKALQEVATHQAVMVFFSKERMVSKVGSPALIKKLSAHSKTLAGFQKQRRNRNNRQIVTPTSTYPVAEEQPLCRKVDMMVDFKEIGWDNWIIYPKKYNAYRCEGSCNVPLKDKVKTTNYDYIKSFINIKEWERVECSACVPVKMRPLSMLFHEDSDVVLRHRDNMIIEECGLL
ncbi:nodal homolog 2-A-like [Gastrophryne carolinensis]